MTPKPGSSSSIAEDEPPTTADRREIVELFPNLELDEVFAEYAHLSSEALIALILDKRAQIPRKPGTCARFVLKACSFAVGLASRCPLGGRFFGGIFSAVAVAIDPNDGRRPSSLSGLKESMECSVCWELAQIADLCFCDSGSFGNERPTTSGGVRRRLSETHAFCCACLERHARAALYEMPLAKGGLGLRCMDVDCDNPINFQEIRAFVSAELAIKLEERCAELSIQQAGLSYMERCRNCNCAVELDASPTIVQVFSCPDCKHQFCRQCDEPWQLEHKGISCAQFAKQQNLDRLLEKRLSEAVVHNCPKCKLAFVKHDGCNKVTCRCGTTHCYICRQNNIDYSHFCKCLHEKRRSGGADFKCNICEKTCFLWQSSVSVEKREMDRIRKEMKEEEERKAKRVEAANRAPRVASGTKAGTSNSNNNNAKSTKKAAATTTTPKQQQQAPPNRRNPPHQWLKRILT